MEPCVSNDRIDILTGLVARERKSVVKPFSAGADGCFTAV